MRLHSRFLAVICALLLCFTAFFGWVHCSNRTFEETFYSVYSPKIEMPVRAVLLSDLHQASFGKNNDDLVSRIEQLQPDVILVAGDMVTKGREKIAYVSNLCSRLVQVAPVFFGLGNHENAVVYGNDLDVEFLEKNQERLGENPEDFSPLIQRGELLDALQDAGVTVVQNQAVNVEINGNQLAIGGLSTNLSSFWPYSGQFIHNFAGNSSKEFRILISHRPEPVMEYVPDYHMDLVVSGHNHGGVIRIPSKGGLFSADGGFFPEYDSGVVESGAMTMVISRGLGGHGLLPRVFNPPELVVIDVL